MLRKVKPRVLSGPPEKRTPVDELFDQLHQIALSCGHAVRGIHFTIRSQRNFRVHMIAGTGALALGLAFGFSRVELAVLVLTVAFVMSAELLNTSLELTMNLLEARNHPVSKMAKDVAAGGVLLAAAGSVVIGIILFVPHFIQFAEGCR